MFQIDEKSFYCNYTMNAEGLYSYIQLDSTTTRCSARFLGIIPIHKLRDITEIVFPSFIIINYTSDVNRRGHWVVIWFTNSRIVELFDSFGKYLSPPPSSLTTFVEDTV